MNAKLLYLATEDWAFHQHFMVMARAARLSGFDVAVATRVQAHGARIADEGIRVIPLAIERGSLGLQSAFAAIKSIVKIISLERPDIVHCIGLPMVVLGGLAARSMRVKKIVLAPIGLGHLWLSKDLHIKILRTLVRLFVGLLLKGSNVHYLFENRDDPAEFGLSLQDDQLTIVGGAGVDKEAFPLTPDPPSSTIKIAVVSRMLRSKGIAESVAAVQMARTSGANIELHLFGIPDPPNPGSFSRAELHTFSKLEGVYWHGQTKIYLRYGESTISQCFYRTEKVYREA